MLKVPKSKLKYGGDRSFSVAAPLTQVLCLGVVAEYLNVKLKFDPKTKKFIGNDEANSLLSGPAPRKAWADHYKIV